MNEITPPVRVVETSVYTTIVDAEGRLITFIGSSFRSFAIAEYIAMLINSKFHGSKRPT
mgnify:CR=1 FL=1